MSAKGKAFSKSLSCGLTSQWGRLACCQTMSKESRVGSVREALNLSQEAHYPYLKLLKQQDSTDMRTK